VNAESQNSFQLVKSEHPQNENSVQNHEKNKNSRSLIDVDTLNPLAGLSLRNLVMNTCQNLNMKNEETKDLDLWEEEVPFQDRFHD